MAVGGGFFYQAVLLVDTIFCVKKVTIRSTPCSLKNHGTHEHFFDIVVAHVCPTTADILANASTQRRLPRNPCIYPICC
jgi:hypothetical protein